MMGRLSTRRRPDHDLTGQQTAIIRLELAVDAKKSMSPPLGIERASEQRRRPLSRKSDRIGDVVHGSAANTQYGGRGDCGKA
jgi:hypothetical protein